MAPQTSTALPVTLSNPAAAGGVLVTLSSSDTSRVTVNPSSIYIAAGANGALYSAAGDGSEFWNGERNRRGLRVGGRHGNSASGSLTIRAGEYHRHSRHNSKHHACHFCAHPGSIESRAPVRQANGRRRTIERNDPGQWDERNRADHRRSSRIHGDPDQRCGNRGAGVGRDGDGSRIDHTARRHGTLGPDRAVPGEARDTGALGRCDAHLDQQQNNNDACEPRRRIHSRRGHGAVFAAASHRSDIGAATITATAPGYSPASQSVPVPATISFSPTSLTITQPGTSQKLLLALSHSAP